MTVVNGTREGSRIRKDLRPAIYVTGDVAREIESPVYAILDMNRQLDAIRVNGATVTRYMALRSWVFAPRPVLLQAKGTA